MSRPGCEPLQMETCFLKVHVNCQGCKQKVKKLLKKLEGVYSVNIDAEHQMVIVTGSVDPEALVKKLIKSGKSAELWSPASNQKQNHKEARFIEVSEIRDNMQYLSNGVHGCQNEHMFPAVGNEVEYAWKLGTYLNQDIGAMNGEIDQKLIPAMEMEQRERRWHAEAFAENCTGKDNMTFLLGEADFQEKDTETEIDAGMRPYEYYHMPSIIWDNVQQGHHNKHPSIDMMNIYMQHRHNGNNMMNEIDMHAYQTQMMNKYAPVPQYIGQGFSSMPCSYY